LFFLDLVDDLCLRDLCFFEELDEELDEELEELDFIVLHLEAHLGSELDELKKLFKFARDISVKEPVLVIFVDLCLVILYYYINNL
jgi:hypothetical protein